MSFPYYCDGIHELSLNVKGVQFFQNRKNIDQFLCIYKESVGCDICLYSSGRK